MPRTHRRLLILPALTLAACGGSGGQNEAAPGSAAPPAEKPADAAPWQVRDTATDTASVRH
jgi:hypothetical protein